MLDGNKSRGRILSPDGPGRAKSIRTVSMIEDGARGGAKLATAWRFTHNCSPQYHAHRRGLKGRSSETIYVIDQLAKSSGAPTVEREDQSRKT